MSILLSKPKENLERWVSSPSARGGIRRLSKFLTLNIRSDNRVTASFRYSQLHYNFLCGGKPLEHERAKLLAELLKEMREADGDRFPDEAWLEIHRTFALPYVELVIPRRVRTTWGIFLTRRASTDPYWPSVWHLPGGLWRTPQTQRQACAAVAARELAVAIVHIKEVMTRKWKTHPYGNPVSHVCLCTPKYPLTGNTEGRFFDSLPTPFIPEQVEFLDESLKYLRKNPDWDSVSQGRLKE